MPNAGDIDGRDVEGGEPGWVHALGSSLRSFWEQPISALVPLPLEIALIDVAGVFGTATPHKATSDLILRELRAALRDPRNKLPAALIAPNGHLLPVIRELIDRPPNVLHNVAERTSALAAIKMAIEELSTAASLEARWEEVVCTFRSGRSTWDRRVWSIDRFRCAWNRSGRDWTFLPHRLRGVLRDSAFEVRLASGNNQDYGVSDLSALMEERAGLTLDERLLLCRKVVGRASERGNCVVWLIFSNARTGRPTPIEIGNVTFLDGPMIASSLQAEVPDSRLPQELHQYRLMIEEDLAGDVVLARVQLDDHEIDSAVEAATNLALALVRYSSLYSHWVWQLRRGHMTFVESNWVAGAFDSRLADEPPLNLPNPEAKFWVAEELTDRAPRLGHRLAARDQRVAEVVELLGSLKEIIDGSAEVRALMVPRLLERIGALVGTEDWPKFLRTHLRDEWALRKVAQIVADDAYGCINADMAAYRGDVLDEPGLGMLVDQVRSGDEFSMAAVVPRLREAASLFVVGSSRWIRLRDSAVGTASGSAVRKWVSHFAIEFDALVARFERCRHGLVHGWPVPAELVETVSGFGASLVVQGVHLSLEGILKDGDVSSGFLAARQRAIRCRDLLANASDKDIGEILYPKPQ